MNTVNEYIGRGLKIKVVSDLLYIPGCSFYHNNRSEERSSSGRGRHNSLFTIMKAGDETIHVDNSIVV